MERCGSFVRSFVQETSTRVTWSAILRHARRLSTCKFDVHVTVRGKSPTTGRDCPRGGRRRMDECVEAFFSLVLSQLPAAHGACGARRWSRRTA
jgi:hypothetical protein